jgi:nucleotidyltransferase/DNA polymerase involved in DNA repair
LAVATLSASRVACIRIPRFPIGAVWLKDGVGARDGESAAPHWDTQPLALTDGTKVRAATAHAAQNGVRAGMTTAQARAKCAALGLLAWDNAVIGREVARASAGFLAASPQVSPERDAPGLWWVGAAGFESIGGERELATALFALARVWHPRARVALADSCVTAHAATWSARAVREPLHVATGSDRDYLARVPIALVPMDPELREALTALGLTTAGAFAALDPLEVERRWDSTGLAAWRLARGDDERRATLARTDDPRVVIHELTTPSPTLEPVLFLLRASLDRLVRTLAADGLAAAALTITLVLDDGRHTTREIRPARPIARIVPLFERCRAALDTWTVDAPIISVTLRVSETAHSTAEQGDLLAPTWRDPTAAEAALARLRATLGADAVVRPIVRDSHAPERAGGWVEVEQAARAVPLDVRTVPTMLATTRLLEAPEPIAITTDKRGTPLWMHWRGRRIALTRADGPERLSGEWWHAEPFAREYWRCESEELGQDLLLYRDSAGWRLHGWYD